MTIDISSSNNGFDSDKNINLDFKQTGKLINRLDIVKKIDAMEIFKKEMDDSNKYRLIVTINPFCTNVLFNTITEVVKDEGSNSPIVVTDRRPEGGIDSSVLEGMTIYGKNGANGEKIERKYMIENTEYSRKEVGFIYHPGYDIFNNHILRSKVFKKVSKKNDNGGEFDNTSNINFASVFNTIEDLMRYEDSSFIPFKKRYDINDTIEKTYYKHIYNMDDIYSFENGDAINENLIEENGWFGFKNKASFIIKDERNHYININKVLNNHLKDEFIDMYPDRTLYQFHPNYNRYKNRLEYNWDIILTYPYKNFYMHDLIYGDGVNGLKVMKIYKGKSQIGSDVIYFRTFSKHGINRNDYFNIYIGNKLYVNNCHVMNVGDERRENPEFYFYTSDLSLLDKLCENEDVLIDLNDDDIINNSDNIRIKRVVNGYESEYYFRLFKRIPNLKFKKGDYNKNEDLNEYLDENSIDDNGNKINFSNESYKLAFSKTIYGDENYQITYTDDINLELLKDNLNRPITEIYTTIIKKNSGNELWYNYNDYGNDKVEFSHCFGHVSSGIDISFDKEDKFSVNTIKKKAALCDSHYINNVYNGREFLFNSKQFEYSINKNNIIGYNCFPYKYIKYNEISTQDPKITEEYSDYLGMSDFIRISEDKINSVYINYGTIETLNTNVSFDIYNFNKKYIKTLRYNGNHYDLNKEIGYKDEPDKTIFIKISFNIKEKNISVTDDEGNIIWKPELEKDVFFGDLCEFNRYEYNEKKLEDIMHRFNTMQREITDKIQKDDTDDNIYNIYSHESYDDFFYKELKSDDYDNAGFSCDETNINYYGKEANFYNISGYGLQSTIRPEGYLYKPHYKVQLNEFGRIIQKSHTLINIREARPIQINGIAIKIRTSSKHNCSVGDKIYVVYNEKWYTTYVSYVENNANFVFSIDITDIFGISNWIDLCEKINDKEIILIKHNDEIPEYAVNIGKNMFVWREFIKAGSRNSMETNGLIFTNDCFYANNNINFYLTRQDRDNEYGVQAKYAFPNDINGEVKKTSKYIYKEEKDILC